MPMCSIISARQGVCVSGLSGFAIRSSRLLSLALLTLMVLAVTTSAFADVTPQQRRAAKEIEGTITRAGKAFQQGDFKKSGELVTEAQGLLEELTQTAEPQLLKLLEKDYGRLRKAHGLLQLEGITLEGLATLEQRFNPDAPMPEDGGVDFVKQIVPVLVGRCGRCHVQGNRGDFSLATYTELMRGPGGNRVVLPGNGDGSRLVQVIEEGDMPRGGGRVQDAELELLKQWIDQGAKADASVRDTNLAVLNADQAPEEEVAMPTLVPATGTETVSFSLDIAPVILANCDGCHVVDRNPRARLNLSNFQGFLRGGDNGALLVQGKPEESLLIGKLKGTAFGERMPQNRPPLSDEVIKKFETWIREGAKFDGDSPQTPIETLAARARAMKATHEELTAERQELAQQNWRLSLPRVAPETVETDDFLVMGNVGRDQLEAVGAKAERLAPAIVRLFKGNSRDPFVKGRMTLFVFEGRYDYSEFGTMVEERSLPNHWSSHWNYTVIDSYVAMIQPRGEEAASDGPLVEQLTAAYIAGIGPGVPEWFANGAALAAVEKLASDDPRIRTWDRALAEISTRMQKPTDFMTGNLPQDEAGLVGKVMVQRLMRDPRFFRLIKALRDGQSFETAFVQLWGATPAQLVAPNSSANRR